MTFPVPPDARAVGDFELVRGIDDMIRQTLPVYDEAADYDPGEWLKPATDAGVTKARKLEAGDVLLSPALGCKVCWTKYRQGDAYNGQSDAMATGTVDLLSGTYQAKTKFYETGTSYTPGQLLVPVYDATKGGILDGFDAAATDAQKIAMLQGVVGRVIEVADGVLHYEAPAI